MHHLWLELLVKILFTWITTLTPTPKTIVVDQFFEDQGLRFIDSEIFLIAQLQLTLFSLTVLAVAKVKSFIKLVLSHE